MKNKLPIEIYDYNFDLVIGAYSGTLISLPHYREIPALNLPVKELYKTDVGINFKKFFALYDEYTPSFEEMECVLTKSKEEIWQHYKKIIDKKPALNDNLNLKKLLMYKPNIIKNIFGRRGFYRMLKEYEM